MARTAGVLNYNCTPHKTLWTHNQRLLKYGRYSCIEGCQRKKFPFFIELFCLTWSIPYLSGGFCCAFFLCIYFILSVFTVKKRFVKKRFEWRFCRALIVDKARFEGKRARSLKVCRLKALTFLSSIGLKRVSCINIYRNSNHCLLEIYLKGRKCSFDSLLKGLRRSIFVSWSGFRGGSLWAAPVM